MKRRDLLGTLGASAAGLAALAAAPVHGQHEDEHAHHHDQIHEACLKACSDCQKDCGEAFHHCYRQVAEGKRDHAKALHLVSDCAGFCGLSVSTISTHSPLMVYSCAACADACHATAAEVERFDDPTMKKTAQSLRTCEKSCREMVASMRAHQTTTTEPGKR